MLSFSFFFFEICHANVFARRDEKKKIIAETCATEDGII
jgi:hypothetical protein